MYSGKSKVLPIWKCFYFINMAIFGHFVAIFAKKIMTKKGDVLLEFSLVKWDLNEDHTLYCNVLGTLLLQNFVLVNSYFNEFL